MAVARPVGRVPVYFHRTGIQDAADSHARVEKIGTAVIVGGAGEENLDRSAVRRGQCVGGNDRVLPEMA
jgi:hypothetical protein